MNDFARNHAGHALQAFVYDGTPRSGKGTIVADLARRYPDSATVETGADFRLITSALIDHLDPAMPLEVITGKVNKVGEGNLQALVAHRQELVKVMGAGALHEPEVDRLVGLVAQVDTVRKVAKAAFKQIVGRLVEQGDKRYLFIDGRNQSAAVQGMPGVRLALNTFVTCSSWEAARRVAEKQGITPSSPGFRELEASLAARRRIDGNREIDPVRPDADALDYWTDSMILRDDNLQWLNIVSQPGTVNAIRPVSQRQRPIRYGAGNLAAMTGRQIIFDTTPISETDMLRAAHHMVLEAIAVPSNGA
jgi:cytidylate kinase